METAGEKLILLAHGDGGALTRELVDNLFHKYLSNEVLQLEGDAAILNPRHGPIALTTDSFVVNPLFFPGGDIGKLAVFGTVNDLAVSGARPEYLAVSFMLEEGLEFAVLEKVVASMAEACREARVQVVAGDTKVVEKGHLDKLFITTTGIGWLVAGADLGRHRIKPGDVVIANGCLGDHGLAVIAERHGFNLHGKIASDCAPLNKITEQLLKQFAGVKLMRDLTRGGLATAAKEIALAAGVDIWLEEASLPVSPIVQGGAQMLGLDPLYLANEGKFLAIVCEEEAKGAVEFMRSRSLGEKAAVIGKVKPGKGNVYLQTLLGGTKFLDLLSGTPLPRIC